jgi:hypothetical protein
MAVGDVGFFEDPISYEEAMGGVDAAEWSVAIQQELDNMAEFGVWRKPEDMSPNVKPVGMKWVFKTKHHADGSLDKRKARLVAQGFTQRAGVDYGETYCPTAGRSSARILFALAASLGFKVGLLDVKSAHLIPTLKEKILAKLPNGEVVELLKAMYGLKQAGNRWSATLSDWLVGDGEFTQSPVDPCLFVSRGVGVVELAMGKMFCVVVHVDDILYGGNVEGAMELFISRIGKSFTVVERDISKGYLGLGVSMSSPSVSVSASKYIADLVSSYGLNEATVAMEPTDGRRLPEPDAPFTGRYREMVGSLNHLAGMVRPDVSYAVNQLARHVSNPSFAHWTAGKRVLRYLKGNPDSGLKFNGGKLELMGYCDADWGGDLDRKSTTGWVIYFCGGPIDWGSKKQTCVAQSSTEAELAAANHCARQMAYLSNVIQSVGIKLAKPIMWCDNQAVIALAANGVFNGRCKHVDVKQVLCTSQH